MAKFNHLTPLPFKGLSSLQLEHDLLCGCYLCRDFSSVFAESCFTEPRVFFVSALKNADTIVSKDASFFLFLLIVPLCHQNLHSLLLAGSKHDQVEALPFEAQCHHMVTLRIFSAVKA